MTLPFMQIYLGSHSTTVRLLVCLSVVYVCVCLWIYGLGIDGEYDWVVEGEGGRMGSAHTPSLTLTCHSLALDMAYGPHIKTNVGLA